MLFHLPTNPSILACSFASLDTFFQYRKLLSTRSIIRSRRRKRLRLVSRFAPRPPPFLPAKLAAPPSSHFNDFKVDPLARRTLRFSLGGGLVVVVVVVVVIIKSFAVPTYPHSEGTESEGHAGLQFVCVCFGGFCTRTSAAFVVVVVVVVPKSENERNNNKNMLRRRALNSYILCISPFEKNS